MLEKINETIEFLKAKGFNNPDAGIILGTGLGGLTAKIENCIEIDYRDIPNFPVPTVAGHEGKLIYGDFGRKKIVAMKGRFHFYEGYGAEEITFPVRVLKYLGITVSVPEQCCRRRQPRLQNRRYNDNYRPYSSSAQSSYRAK